MSFHCIYTSYLTQTKDGERKPYFTPIISMQFPIYCPAALRGRSDRVRGLVVSPGNSNSATRTIALKHGLPERPDILLRPLAKRYFLCWLLPAAVHDAKPGLKVIKPARFSKGLLISRPITSQSLPPTLPITTSRYSGTSIIKGNATRGNGTTVQRRGYRDQWNETGTDN
jgi:hypothetical protein